MYARCAEGWRMFVCDSCLQLVDGGDMLLMMVYALRDRIRWCTCFLLRQCRKETEETTFNIKYNKLEKVHTDVGIRV